MLNSRAHRLYSLTRSGSGGGGGGCDHVILDKVDIELNLANGDQTATVPNGASAKTAIIKKPETLVPENIAKDVDIAGVVGTMSAGGGDFDALVKGTLTELYSEVESVRTYACAYTTNLLRVNLPNATTIHGYAFWYCSKLASVTIPNLGEISSNCFSNCNNLTTVDFPEAVSVRGSAFKDCPKLVTLNLPKVSTISSSAFSGCLKLPLADFPNVTKIENYAFYTCSVLKALVLRAATMVTLSNTNAFMSTPIANGTGYIYVPASLKSQYESAANWSTYAAQFRALEDYTVDGTTTGALDPTKI